MQEETAKHRCCLQFIGSGARDQVRLVMDCQHVSRFPRRSTYVLYNAKLILMRQMSVDVAGHPWLNNHVAHGKVTYFVDCSISVLFARLLLRDELAICRVSYRGLLLNTLSITLP